MYYVYVLNLSNNDLYIGYSDNLKERYKSHCEGKVKSTKAFRPLRLVYYEAYAVKEDATKREYFLKSHQQKQILKERIEHSIMARWPSG